MKKFRNLILIALAFLVSLPGKFVERSAYVGMFSPIKPRAMAAGNPARGNQIADCEITVTNPTSGGDNTVVCQMKGINGQDLTAAGVVYYYLSTDSAGQTLATDGTDTSDIVIATDGTILSECRADIAGMAICEVDGDLAFTVTVVTGHTAYLNIVLPDGTIVTSDVLTYV